MDSALELVWIAGVAIYYIWSATRRSKRKREARTTGTAPEAITASGETRSPTPFQEFMLSMEEAMREGAQPQPAQEVEKPLSAPDTLVPEPVPASTIPPARVEEFHEMGSFKGDGAFESSTRPARGFGLDSPFSEERFERLARGRDIVDHDHGPLAPPLPPRRLSRAGQWRERLQDPKEAQDALVLAEIFGGPWKARRPHKR